MPKSLTPHFDAYKAQQKTQTWGKDGPKGGNRNWYVYQVPQLPQEVFKLHKQLKEQAELTYRQAVIASFYLAGLVADQQPDLWIQVVTKVKEKYPSRKAPAELLKDIERMPDTTPAER